MKTGTSSKPPPRPDGVVRLVSWNVAQGLPKKFELLEVLEPDIAIIPEASDESSLLRAGIDRFSSAVWIGRNPNKGLLALGFGDWKIKMIYKEWDQRLEWILPIEAKGPTEFKMLAVWSQNARAKVEYPSERYKNPRGHLLEAYPDLLRSGCVLMGDFNHHPRWDKGDKSRDFSANVEGYREADLNSAWHSFHDVELGDRNAEPATLWWRWQQDQPYMIDYCFLPNDWLPFIRNAWIGGYDEYGAVDPRSDHAPMVVDVSLEAIRS